MKTKLQEFINTISYYNAAESPQYGKEATERNAAKKEIFDTISSWNITEAEFKALYDECNKGLTTYSEFYRCKFVGGSDE